MRQRPSVEAYPTFDGYRVLEAQPAAEAWQEEVDRRSPEYVRWVQRSLNRILGLRLAEDGLLGSQTRSAIRRFQQRARLSADGSVGPRTEAALVAAGAAPPPAPGRAPGPSPALSPAARATPRLIRQETSPPATTLYVEIDLGILDERNRRLAQPMTGIFIPEDYAPAPRVDLILYLHGFKRDHPDLTIDGYWNSRRFPFWTLREGLNQSRKNAILVAPTLGPRAQTGRLIRAGGFDAYLDQVLAALRAYGPYRGSRTPPALGSLILACHSAGGYPMRALALGRERYAANIRECWGFDCMYNRGDDELWAGWARSRPAARLYVYYLSSTERLSLSLKQKNLPNVQVQRSTARGHNWVPITHWQERLRSSAFLPERQPAAHTLRRALMDEWLTW